MQLGRVKDLYEVGVKALYCNWYCEYRRIVFGNDDDDEVIVYVSIFNRY